MITGDPRQIEPVFTLPSALINALARLSSSTSAGAFSPHLASVQTLADAGNRFGAYLPDDEDAKLWVGSPLRVHRRCIEPMFSWSNEIAYGGRMIFGLPSADRPDGPPVESASAWVDLGGSAQKRQEVPAQTDFIVEAVLRLYARDGKLPELYIISPFRAVRNEIRRRLMLADWMRGTGVGAGPRATRLRRWCSERVGTVHTFQGREEDTVILVLGADEAHRGAAQWACSRPNILNVALTRARRRFYVVGDRKLWGSMGPFRFSERKLPSVTAEQFLTVVLRCG